MAKPKSRPQLSLLSAHGYDDAAGIAEEHWSRLFFEQVRCNLDDAEFADLYQEGGRYPVSPGFLASILVLQYLLRVSDRMAVENTIMRRDWRMALGVTADYAGFCPTVLTRFRQRLAKAGQQGFLFEKVLARCGAMGLLRGRRVRVDAMQMLSDLAQLNRADSIQEAIRVVVAEAEGRYPELWSDPESMRLYEQYGVECWLGGGSSSEARLTDLGRDGYRLLALLGQREVAGKATLAENFIVGQDEARRPREPQERPDDRIVTPHEPEARYGRKGDRIWLGRQVHVTEMTDAAGPKLVTGVLVTDPRREDSTVLPEIVEQVRSGTPEVDTVIADAGYASAANSATAAEQGIDLVTPARSGHRRGRLSAETFELDFERQVARCPEGQTSAVWSVGKRALRIRFPAAAGVVCPRRSECTASSQGRMLHLSLHYQQLQRDRARTATEAFRNLCRERAGLEATLSKLIQQHGLRRSRYRGAPFEELHAYLAVTALNVRRMLAWLSQAPGRASSAAPLASTAAITVPSVTNAACGRLKARHALRAIVRLVQRLWPSQALPGRLIAASA